MVPSPRREPDGSWSSPLTPKPPPRPLGPTQARHGRPGGPGFQPARSDSPGISQWQRSHQAWTGAGIQWEQEVPAAQIPPRPAGPHPVTRPGSRSGRLSQAPGLSPGRAPRHVPGRAQPPRQPAPQRPPAVPQHVPGRQTRPGPPVGERPEAYAPDEAYAPEEALRPGRVLRPEEASYPGRVLRPGKGLIPRKGLMPRKGPCPGRVLRPECPMPPKSLRPRRGLRREPAASWPGHRPGPLGAPVYSNPGLDSDDDQARGDRWDDDRPPIRERPASLAPPRAPGRPARPPGAGQSGRRSPEQARSPARPTGPRAAPRPGIPSCSITGCPAISVPVPAGVAVAPRRSWCPPSCWWPWPSWPSRC